MSEEIIRYDMNNKVDRYASLLKEEVPKKMATKWAYYKNPIISYAGTDSHGTANDAKVEVSSIKDNIEKPLMCKEFFRTDNSKMKIPNSMFPTREPKT